MTQKIILFEKNLLKVFQLVADHVSISNLQSSVNPVGRTF